MKVHYGYLIFILCFLAGCSSSPEKPAADATLPACGALPNCVNSQATDGGKAIDPLKASAFRDDVQLMYKETEGFIHVRSSSRFGISDMGTNRRRVEMLRSELATGLQ